MSLLPDTGSANGRTVGPRTDAVPPAVLAALVEALGAIRYGAIEIVIHDGRIVQIERREKVRFEGGAGERGR
jgi:hypothetical protein